MDIKNVHPCSRVWHNFLDIVLEVPWCNVSILSAHTLLSNMIYVYCVFHPCHTQTIVSVRIACLDSGNDAHFHKFKGYKSIGYSLLAIYYWLQSPLSFGFTTQGKHQTPSVGRSGLLKSPKNCRPHDTGKTSHIFCWEKLFTTKYMHGIIGSMKQGKHHTPSVGKNGLLQSPTNCRSHDTR